MVQLAICTYRLNQDPIVTRFMYLLMYFCSHFTLYVMSFTPHALVSFRGTNKKTKYILTTNPEFNRAVIFEQ